MSDQRSPDGEFAKQAISIARELLNLEGKNSANLKREEYLKTVAQCVRALQGYEP